MDLKKLFSQRGQGGMQEQLEECHRQGLGFRTKYQSTVVSDGPLSTQKAAKVLNLSSSVCNHAEGCRDLDTTMMQIHIHIHISIYTHTYAYIYIYIYMHAHIET